MPYRDDRRLLESRAQELRQELLTLRAKAVELEELRGREARLQWELVDIEERSRHLARTTRQGRRVTRLSSRSKAVAVAGALTLVAGASTFLARTQVPVQAALPLRGLAASVIARLNVEPPVNATLRVGPAGAELYVDGERRANPFIGRLARGRHRVVASAPGHFVRTLDVNLDEDTVIDLRLPPAPPTPGSRSRL